MGRVDNKVIVVTGGALGIGKAACLLLAKEGAKVAVTDIKDTEGRALADKINKDGGESYYWRLDVSDEDEVETVFHDIQFKYGPINVLVNNAGISGTNKPTHEVTAQEWDSLMKINVNGVFFCTKHALPQMEKLGSGSIINLSSIYGIIGSQDFPPYHASKGAVRLMTKTDAMMYAGKNIRVNSIHPGYIWTPMVENIGKASAEGIEKFRENMDKVHPIGHVGEPDDIAYGILYLASEESKFMTGSELVIDGGYTAR